MDILGIFTTNKKIESKVIHGKTVTTVFLFEHAIKEETSENTQKIEVTTYNEKDYLENFSTFLRYQTLEMFPKDDTGDRGITVHDLDWKPYPVIVATLKQRILKLLDPEDASINPKNKLKIYNKIINQKQLIKDYSDFQKNGPLRNYLLREINTNINNYLNNILVFDKSKQDMIPSFIYFKENVPKFLSKLVFEIVQNNPQFITSDFLTIQLRIKNIGDYTEIIYSDSEYICIDISGAWLVQSIIAPLFYLKNIDAAYITRFLTHQLARNNPKNKILMWEDGKNTRNNRIKMLAKRKSTYVLNCIENTLFDMREGGLAEFVTRKDQDKIDIYDKPATLEFKRNLKNLIEKTYKKDDCETFYEKNIGYLNQTSSGAYAMGRFMCLIIALNKAKDLKKGYNLCLKDGTVIYFGYDCNKLDSHFLKHDLIYVKGLSKEVLLETINDVQKTAHYYFIRLYEKACKSLGLNEKNMIITSKEFYKLKKDANYIAFLRRKKKLKDLGFVSTDEPVKIEELK